MAKFIFPNSIKFSGPWLIGFDQLMELDDILQDEWVKLQKNREDEIQKKVDEQLKEMGSSKNKKIRAEIEKQIKKLFYFDRNSKNIELNLKSGKKLEVSSFRDAAKEKSIVNELPTSFDVKMECLDVNIKLSIEESTFDSQPLRFSVTPASYAENSDFFLKVERWIERLRPAKWLKIWKNLKGFQWGIFFFLFLFISLFALAKVPSKAQEYKKTLIPEAHRILKDGMKNSDQKKALEILLAMETGYYPKDFQVPKSNIPNWCLFFLALFFIISIVLSFPPRSYIGLGRGEKKIKLWQKWLKLIYITIPTLLGTGVLLPLVLDLIKRYLL